MDFSVAKVRARIVPFTVIAFAIALAGEIVTLMAVNVDDENLAVAIPFVVVIIGVGLFAHATLWTVGPALAIHRVPGYGIVPLMVRSIRRGGLAMVGAGVSGLLVSVGYELLLLYVANALGIPGLVFWALLAAGVLAIYVFLFVFSAVLWKHRRFEILGLDESTVPDMQTADEPSREAAPTGEAIARSATFEPCENCGNVFNAAVVRCPQCLHERSL